MSIVDIANRFLGRKTSSTALENENGERDKARGSVGLGAKAIEYASELLSRSPDELAMPVRERPPMDYHEFHGFTQAPFELSPDPALFVMSNAHQDALDRFYRGILSERGFLVLTGEVGTGKTLLLHTIMGLLDKSYHIAYVFHSHLDSADLLELILNEFGVQVPAGANQAMRLKAMSDFLIESRRQGRRPLLIIDEAQNLSPTTLEEMRMISNLETHEGKLLQFVLAGQSELIELLNAPELRQLKQRIAVRSNLMGLTATETSRYIQQRCEMSGAASCPFSRPIILHIYALTLGVPRLINSVCDSLLLNSFLDATHEITVEQLKQLQKELDL